MPEYDAVVVGSGPNGLAAAIKLAEKGLSVLILEAKETPGGGVRTAELTLPGFLHDVCSAVHPLGYGSPFFKTLPLEKFGLEWIFSPIEMAHPFDDGSAALLYKSIDETAESLDEDKDVYKNLMNSLVEDWKKIEADIMGPIKFPSHPFTALKFGLKAIPSAETFSKRYFKGKKAEAFFAGLSAHSFSPLTNLITASFGLVLGIYGHLSGWPFPKGGSQNITKALVSYFESLGGKIQTGINVKSFKDIPSAKAVLFDITPRQLIKIAGNKLPLSYILRLEKYRYGAGAFKIDFALSEPVPFKNDHCRKSCTLHLGGWYKDIKESERRIWEGKSPEKPFTIAVQQSLFDSTRAPHGKHTLWAYCHVPESFDKDISDVLIRQIERFAPGFRDIILEKHIISPKDYEEYNPNYIGGDINGGVQDWRQLFTRPVISFSPYSTPAKGIYLCSSSTPPGGGVHGLCGFHAAKKVIKDLNI
jgi:phytoene dehydrogenase-like protein